ncbi:hypothetical protein PI125_g12974 [Phytophthora idaei]|nr:hypothetical protein PI125_g12974 [Phytophthora idaei]KAG3148722.1 hypothetical protein PI126_g12331 [Phytophthora idaei]
MERHLNGSVPTASSGLFEFETAVPSSSMHTFRTNSRSTASSVDPSELTRPPSLANTELTAGCDRTSDPSISRKFLLARFASVDVSNVSAY